MLGAVAEGLIELSRRKASRLRSDHRWRGPRAAAILVGMSALLVAGCGGSSSSKSSEPTPTASAPVTLRVIGNGGWDFLKNAGQIFEKSHPYVKVKIETEQSESYFQNLPRTLSSGNGPDVTALETHPGPYDALVEEKLLAPLDEIWTKENLESVYPATVNKAFTAPDGHHYGVNIDIWWPVIWYSKPAFAKAGITAPSNGQLTSQAQLFEMGKKLKAAGYPVPFTAGVSDEGGASYIFASLVESSCGDEGYTNLTSNWRSGVAETTKWTSPCVLKALELEKSYNSNGFMGGSPATTSDEQAVAYFEQGKAGMYITGSWGANEFTLGKISFPYGWMLMPPVEGGSPTKFLQATYDGMGVPASSKHKKLASEFISLLAGRQVQSESWFASTLAGIPGRTDATVKVPEYQPTVVEMAAAIPKVGGNSLLYTEVPWGGTMAPALATMWTGEKSPSDVANEFQKATEEARSNPNA
jgi:raffinose/stachyose/melibiose transport system substrate-binding protein